MEYKETNIKKANKRQMNFELLRIICMIMIISTHFLGHGEILDKSQYGSFSYVVYWFLRAAVYPGVNCFVLLTGYFMVKSSMNVSKIFKFAVQVWVYTILCFVIHTMIFSGSIGIKVLYTSFLPLISNTYWFSTQYVLLLLAVPFLNIIIKNINKKQHLLFIGILLTVYCVVPSFAYWTREYFGQGKDLMWFVTLYVTSSYISIYGLNLSKIRCVLGYVISISGLLLSNLLIAELTQRIIGVSKAVELFYRNNSPFVFVAAICLFVYFKETKINNLVFKTIISKISPYAFGVYLFHENPLIRLKLWGLIKPYRFMDISYGTILTIVYMLISALLIYLIGSLINIIYNCIFNGIVKKISAKIDENGKKWMFID